VTDDHACDEPRRAAAAPPRGCPGAPRRVRRVRFAICAATLALSLLAGEVLVRWIAHDAVATAALREDLARRMLTRLMRPSRDPALHYELVPGLVADFLGDEVRIDADGFRAIARVPLAIEGIPLRLAIVGASSTFGHGVAPELTWPELLAPRLAAALRRPLELRNFSVPGYVATQQARIVERFVVPWRPDVVLWHYDHRDAAPAIGRDHPTYLPPELGDNPLRSALLKLLLRRIHEARLEARRESREPTATFDGYACAGPAYDRHVAAIQDAAARLGAQGAASYLVVFDSLVRVGELGAEHVERLHGPLTSALAPHFRRVVDLYPRVRSWLRDGGELEALWVSRAPRDVHPGPLYHERIADWLFEALVADLGASRAPAHETASEHDVHERRDERHRLQQHEDHRER
jgi:hypothetical protein